MLKRGRRGKQIVAVRGEVIVVRPRSTVRRRFSRGEKVVYKGMGGRVEEACWFGWWWLLGSFYGGCLWIAFGRRLKRYFLRQLSSEMMERIEIGIIIQ